jgi:hypothetical protein
VNLFPTECFEGVFARKPVVYLFVRQKTKEKAGVFSSSEHMACWIYIVCSRGFALLSGFGGSVCLEFPNITFLSRFFMQFLKRKNLTSTFQGNGAFLKLDRQQFHGVTKSPSYQ